MSSRGIDLWRHSLALRQAGLGGGTNSQVGRGHRQPGRSGVVTNRIVAVAGAIRDPIQAAAAGSILASGALLDAL